MALLLCAWVVPFSALAGSFTWDGGGSDANWTTGANWEGDTSPSNDGSADLLFTDSDFTTSPVDLDPNLDVNHTVQSLTFAGDSSFALSSNDNSGVYIGGGGLSQDSVAAQTISVPVYLTANQTLSFASGAAMLSLSGSGVINNEGYTLSLSTPDANTLAGDITGAGAVTLTGSGTLTLSGMNTYQGGTVFNAGTLKLGSSGALGTSGPLVFNGGTSQYSVNNTTDYSGRFSTASNQAYSVDTKAQNVTFASSLVSSGGSLTKLGLGTLTLTAQNTYTGGTVFGAGTINVGSVGALGNGGTLSFMGGVLQYSVANQIDYSSQFATTANQQYSIDTNGQTITFASPLTSNGGSLTKLGTGTLTLTASNSYTGGTTISAGTLQIGAGGTSGSLGGGSVTDNASLVFDRSDTVNMTNVIGGSGGSLTVLGGGTLTLTAANTYTGGTTISAGTLQIGAGGTNGSLGGGSVTDNASLVFDRSDTVNLTNVINGSGSLTQSGSGTLAITSTNGYMGGTTFGAGTLKVGKPGALGSTGLLSFTGGTLQFSSSNATDYSSRFSTADGQAYSIDTNNQSVTFASDLTSNGGTLTKLGLGTLTLTGANTYDGTTTVGGGTLLANNASGSATGTGAVQVDNGGALGGSGTIAGRVVVANGGMLLPGNSPVLLTIDNALTFNSGSALGIVIGGLTPDTQYDQVQVSGSLALHGNLSVSTINGFTLAVGQTFVVLDEVGTTLPNGFFANTTATSIYTDAAGDTFFVNYLDNADGGAVPNDVSLTVLSVVPEPKVQKMLYICALLLGASWAQHRLRTSQLPRSGN